MDRPNGWRPLKVLAAGAHPVPSRSVPSRSVPSRSVPSRSVPSRSVPSRSVPGGLAIAGLVTAGLVTALGPTGAALAAGRPYPAPAASPSCSLVPPVMVRSALGEPAQAPVEAHPVPSATTCTYAVGTNSLGVQVTFLQVSWSAFEAVEQDYLKGGAMKVDGLGQAAFAVSSRSTPYENLFFYGDGYNMGVIAEAPLAKMVDLARAVLTRLQ